MPKLAHPTASSGQELMERSQGVKVSSHQFGRFCQQVAGSDFSNNACPQNDCAMTTLHQSNTVPVTLQAT